MGIDDSGVGFDAVSLGRRRLDFEAHLLVRGVPQPHHGAHGGREGT